MKAWIVTSASKVAPFGEAGALPVLGRPLRDVLIAEIAEAGLTLAGGAPGDGIHVPSDVYVNAAALRALAERGPGRIRISAPGWARLAGGAAERDVPVEIPGGGAVAIDAGEKPLSLARGRDELAIAAPRRIAVRIETWSDLLWANLFGMASRIVSMSPAKGAALVLLAALRARSLDPWRVAGKLVEKGKGCDVHPTAVVEASVLGAGVRIGAGAVVRGSILGDGAEVEELALVSGAVLGARALVERFAMVKFSVLGDGAIAGGVVQLSVLGRDSALRLGSYTMDRPLDGRNVRVSGPSGLVEAGPTLGVALGDGASVGSGVWIAPGRAIPAGVVVTRGPQDVLTRIPAALEPGVYAVEGGSLVVRK